MKHTILHFIVFCILAHTACVGQKPTRGYQQDPDATLVKADTTTQGIALTESDTTFTFLLEFQLGDVPAGADYQQIYTDIDRSIALANDYFQGAVRFIRSEYVYEFQPEGTDIYTLFDHFVEQPKKYDRWVNERVVDTAITVFVLPTYAKGGRLLTGFCPVLTSEFEYYEKEYPRFDHLFVSYTGLAKGHTLGHELGHWLGLSHVFEMSDKQREEYGIASSYIAQKNLMNYVPNPNSLTPEQVYVAWRMAHTYRAYRLH